jgi:hypothetical protein
VGGGGGGGGLIAVGFDSYISISYFINIAVQNVNKALFTLRVESTFNSVSFTVHTLTHS